MSMRFLVAAGIFASAALLLVSPASAQSLLTTVSTSQIHPVLSPDAPDFTFGCAIDPTGAFAFVSVSGRVAFAAPGNYNNRILKIDLATGTIVDEGTAGLFPEDLAIVVDGQGALDRLYVADNGGSSVTVLDPNLSTVATVNLGLCFGSYSQFPFELAVSADQTRLFVGSSGCDNLFIIDIDPASPSYHTILSTVTYTGSHGAVAVHPSFPAQVVVGSSVLFGTFSGAYSQVDLVDLSPATPQVTSFPVGPQTTGDYASINGILPLTGNRVLLVENSQFAARLYEFDLALGQIVATHDLATTIPGLANLARADLSANGRIVAVTDLDRRVIFYDLASRNVVSTIVYAGSPQPTTIARVPGSDRAVVCFQNDEAVRIYGSLPESLNLTTSGPAQSGQPFAFITTGGAPFDAVLLAYSGVGAGPEVLVGYEVALSSPIELFQAFPTDGQGIGFLPLTVPGDPAFIGLTAYFQAATFQPQATLRLSEPVTVTVVP